MSIKGRHGSVHQFSMKSDFIAVIETNQLEPQRRKLFEKMIPLVGQLQCQRGNSSDFLCRGDHGHPGNYSFKEYIRFFLHVQHVHFEYEASYCLVCGDKSLTSHFRAAYGSKLAGKGYLGTCKTKIDSTNPRL